jgi:ATP-dependent Zn protease
MDKISAWRCWSGRSIKGALAQDNSERVSEIIREEMEATVKIIADNKPRLDRMVEALLLKNKLTREEMETLLSL